MKLIIKNLGPIKNNTQAIDLSIDFQGILFYRTFSGKNKPEGEHDITQLYSILQTPNKSGILTCETILKKEDKIKIKCFHHPDVDSKTEIRRNLKDLL
ncbi:MAG: hypothetical protein F6K62_17695 [Sphaerospermopsis sp. SIO1G2]|nr:hypothetical protein [Sphaerospermopsis sp. SIO1G2]